MYRLFPYLLACSLAPLAGSAWASLNHFPYINESDDFVMVAKVNTTQEWKNYTSSKPGYWDNGYKHEKEIYSDSELKKLFKVTLSAIQKATETKLNRPIEVLGITYHDVMIGDLNNLLDVAIELLPGMKDGSQLRNYLHSMRLGYRLNTAEALGYPAGTDIDQESNLLLHFDYQDSRLEVSITDGGTKISLVEQRFKIPDFGGVGQIASLEKLEHLAARLKYFVKIALSDSQPPELTEFRRIIFSGNAPASEFQKIRETIIKVIPDFTDRFSEGIDPAWVSAVGAARRAKEYMLNPPNWDYEFQEQVYGDESHDEL
ncbi:uncharacterized protein EAE98_010307 [Botrytis deweyae]|uniref:Uncharacterized protein n=1 Tax=Botrytis deweyae TaxID=2478750 RepID=A0ABQ7I933_9HELO|nr:uncharacterized protein EAE98_010307 [Botrytis deweyae]KAF7917202.1 hypothetical protein EAE98_010307 [Botrytis deweyae]